jgi:hypothetical protein
MKDCSHDYIYKVIRKNSNRQELVGIYRIREEAVMAAFNYEDCNYGVEVDQYVSDMDDHSKYVLNATVYDTEQTPKSCNDYKRLLSDIDSYLNTGRPTDV